MDKTYCYAPDYSVLKNKHDIRDADALQEVEALLTRLRMRQPPDDPFEMTPQYYRHLHHHIFQDVYEWAGEYRSTELWKGRSGFELPREIAPRLEDVFTEFATLPAGAVSDSHAFARQAAKLMHELNDVHPFREGNGRTQRLFLEGLGRQAGFQIDTVNIDRTLWMEGALQSFAQGSGSEHPAMTQCIETAINLSRPLDMGHDLGRDRDDDHGQHGHDHGRSRR